MFPSTKEPSQARRGRVALGRAMDVSPWNGRREVI